MAKRKKSSGLRSWNSFLKRHGGKGYSRAQLKRMYASEVRGASRKGGKSRGKRGTSSRSPFQFSRSESLAAMERRLNAILAKSERKSGGKKKSKSRGRRGTGSELRRAEAHFKRMLERVERAKQAQKAARAARAARKKGGVLGAIFGPTRADMERERKAAVAAAYEASTKGGRYDLSGEDELQAKYGDPSRRRGKRGGKRRGRLPAGFRKWQAFLRRHAGMGYSRKELSRMFKAEQSGAKRRTTKKRGSKKTWGKRYTKKPKRSTKRGKKTARDYGFFF